LASTLSIHEAFAVAPGLGGGKPSGSKAGVSLRDLGRALWRRRRLIALIQGSLLLACVFYCVVAPDQYEAVARVELRTSPASSLNFEANEPVLSASILSAPLTLETLAGVLRSDQLAWRVIAGLRLYQAQGFCDHFAGRFPRFQVDSPSPDAQAWLLDRFSRRLKVQTVPRTLLIEIRFRSHDPALSASIVNTLVRAYIDRETESQIDSTTQASRWLGTQLGDLKARVESDQQRLADFESRHGIVSTPEVMANGQPGETEHSSALLEIDELSRQLVASTTDRILTEARYRAASQGDPELVIAADPHLQAEGSDFATAVLQQIRARRSDLEQEQAQLSAEHGPGFPRVVEISRQLQDLDKQKVVEDAKLVERFRSNWQTALDREQLVRKSLQQVTSESMKLNEATTEYAVMRQEANASHDLYVRVQQKAEEAGLAAGVHSSSISVIDYARQPVKPVAPDPPVYLAISFVVGFWLAVAVALLRDSLASASPHTGAILIAFLAICGGLRAQPPMPNTSGLPSGVVKVPLSQDNRPQPNSREAPAIWSGLAGTAVAPSVETRQTAPLMPALIAPGDVLDVTEFHTPEFHSSVRVSSQGLVTLPMVGDVQVSGMDEQSAARAVDAALLNQGMLLHPLVTVLVTAYVGQDVSVLGEVARPGVYPFTYHHRLLDLISAASGLSPNAGRLVNVFHQGDPKAPHAVVLDPSGVDTASDHNPELSPGDTVQVSRAGLVYVVGDVIRPGGFAVDPVQGLTVVQALSLAWGASQNAGARAILIREQKGGRTMISLNLKRMLRGQDPDQLVQDRDILYVPNSVTREVLTKTLESAIQSAVGVSIYSGLVYSQWLLPKSTTSSTSVKISPAKPPAKPLPRDPVARRPGIEEPQ